MTERRPKRPRDPNELAKRIVDAATGDKPDRDLKKTAAQSAGGKKGAASRAETLTPEERAEIARVAARARWKKSD